MRRLMRLIAAASGLIFLLSVAAAHAGPAFRVVTFNHRNDGADQLFTADIQDSSDHDVYLRGRLIVIDVYDTSLPTVLAFGDQNLHAGETVHLEARWSGASVIGSIRTLLILSNDGDPSYVEASNFWIGPVGASTALLGLALCAALIVLVLGGMRLMRRRQQSQRHLPQDTVAHRVEAGESVMSVAELYGVAWQDLAKLNRLKPPYELKPGIDLFIRRHPLRKPPVH